MTQSPVQLLNDQSMTTSSKGSSRFPICCRHIGKGEDPGDKSPKAFPACYSTQLGPIPSQVINNFVFVASFSTFSAQPGCLFDHLRIYRKIARKRAQIGLTAQNWPPFPVSDEMLLFLFNIFQICKKSCLELRMLMKLRLHISYKQKRLLELAKR